VAAKKKELSLLLSGNSAEVIARLEEDYDFSGLSVKEREQAQKWYMAERPSASLIHGVEFRAANYAWLKWNLTNKGNHSTHYEGHLVKEKDNRDFSDHGEEEDEAGAVVE
jgi:hypothetical protein